MRRRSRLLVALLLACGAAAAQQPPDERVVVTADAYPVAFENLSRAVTVLTREDIARLPAHSIADLLSQAVSVDLASRAPFGIQSDISARGSAFSQVLVLVDGVRINDSQTGHHNSDFPVQLQDVERVEVLLGPGSSLYGADAFGGTVNIITRRGTEQAHGAISGGQYGLFQAEAGAGFREGELGESLSVSAGRSSGFEYDREFSTVAATSRTSFGRSSLYVSFLDKEFGANQFYGPAPSQEWTSQTLVAFERSPTQDDATGLRAYYRTHSDRFVYDIRSPDLFESRQRTHAAGLEAKTRLGLSDSFSLAVGGELGGDGIVSTGLGDHLYARASIFGEGRWTLGKSAALYPGLRLDAYTNYGAAVSPSLSGSWWVGPRLRLRASAGRAFRIPTFTELYYSDPNHQADPALRPESAYSGEVGADFTPANGWLGSLTLFARDERNVIDWVRASAGEKWRSANIQRIRAAGMELALERSLGRLGLGSRYSRTELDAGVFGYVSEYALDYARDSWSASSSFRIRPSLGLRQTARFTRRADGRSYWILDGSLQQSFGRFAASLDVRNLLDTRYQEIVGVDMPGRWILLTLSTR